MDERNDLTPDGRAKAVGIDDDGSTVAFCGSAAAVQEGFAIALRAMGIGIPGNDASLPAGHLTLEDR